MEPIDAGFEKFQKFRNELSTYDATLFTEQDTRVKVVDRVLHDVLGWPFNELSTEARAGKGFIDYLLTVDDHSRVVVEAKRDGRELGTSECTPGRPFRLDGPVFTPEAAEEGIDQAIGYAAYKSAELACVTNGREWMIFRANRLGDGRDTLSGMAFVFPSIEAIADHFKLFWSLLSYDSCRSFAYRPHFQEAEGAPVRSVVFRQAVRRAGTQRLVNPSTLAADISSVMASFFRRISDEDDKALLSECFVDTQESEKATARLARISEDLIGKVKSISAEPEDAQLNELIRRAIDAQRQDFVVIVGTKGAGKSTFIDRFFALRLDRELATDCVVAGIDLRSSQGDPVSVVDWLTRQVLSVLEETLHEDGHPTFDEIRGMFFDEYKRLSTGPLSAVYERSHREFHEEFGRIIETKRETHPHDYVKGLLRHAIRNRKKMPVVVLDNADHFSIEFQQLVYQFARSLYEDSLCLVILPITDRTSWQLSQQGALQSFEHEALFLPAPPMRRVLSKRIAYLQQRVAEAREEGGRYFMEKGIRLSVDDLGGFVACLQRVFIEDDRTAQWISNLANGDVRRALQLAGQVISSPQIRVADLVKAYISGDNGLPIPPFRVRQAIIRQAYDVYPVGQHEFVQNVFALTDEVDTSPLLGLRLLKLLSDAPVREHEGQFLDVDHVLDYMTAMQVGHQPCLSWLQALLKAGLCWSYDPTTQAIHDVRRIEIAPSGRQHLVWGSSENDYLTNMALVTPLVERATWEQLRDLEGQPVKDTFKQRLRVFAAYLLREDAKYCQVPGHEAYRGQLALGDAIETFAK